MSRTDAIVLGSVFVFSQIIAIGVFRFSEPLLVREVPVIQEIPVYTIVEDDERILQIGKDEERKYWEGVIGYLDSNDLLTKEGEAFIAGVRHSR